MGRNRVNKFLRWRRKGVHSAPDGAWQPDRPLSVLVMSATLMTASCDSIGSCSLDVDIDADSQAGQPATGAASLSEATLHSLLLSASAHSAAKTGDVPCLLVTADCAPPSTPSAPAKKPSYLNLACSISGYGGITTYDSKLREGFRSRDHSPGPGRLLPVNGSREASPARPAPAPAPAPAHAGKRLTVEPPSSGRRCWTPSPVSGQPRASSAMKHVSPTAHLVAANGTPQGEHVSPFGAKRFTEQRSKWLESTLASDGKGTVTSVVESSASKGRGLDATTTRVETRIEANASATSVSTTVITTSYNACSERIKPTYSGESPPRSGLSNGSSSHPTPVSSKKSFIQQRVERLYGPGALAQGFFHRSGRSPGPTSPSSRVHNISITKSSESSKTPVKSPELPVLRHLRPEFREQLPVVGSATRRSFGVRTSTSSPSRRPQLHSPSNSTERRERTSIVRGSTESLADLQPAAPEVVLPVEKVESPSQTVAAAHKEAKPRIEPRVAAEAPADVVDEAPRAAARLNGSAKPTEKVVSVAEVAPKSAPSVTTNGVAPAEDNPGYRFLKMQRQEIEILLKLAEKAEAQMEASTVNGEALPEEALGHLRAAAGQARLLVRQKMVQFEGLCRKSMCQAPDEPFPTTPEDLQGFWDMVLLQVRQVHNTFERLERLRAVGWDEEKLGPEEGEDTADAPGQSAPAPRKATRPSRSAKSAPASAAASAAASAKAAEAAEARKAREEQRRKMMEERRKQMKKQKQESVEIFAPDTS